MSEVPLYALRLGVGVAGDVDFTGVPRSYPPPPVGPYSSPVPRDIR